MIQATASSDIAPVTFTARVRGLAIHLDNWALGDLAEGDPSRRARFLTALRSGVADLMFSVTNVVELAGLRGRSYVAVKSFLNEIGPNWFPVELDVYQVTERERKGADLAEACISEGFMRAYFENRVAAHSREARNVIDLSDGFYCLGDVLDWVGLQHDHLREQSRQLDQLWRNEIRRARSTHGRNQWLPVPFDSSKPATFTLVNLVRDLVATGQTLRKNDALDLCHAVMGSSFASFATLDGPWKRRVERLPKPNKLALIYDGPQLNQMVTDIESAVNQKLLAAPGG